MTTTRRLIPSPSGSVLPVIGGGEGGKLGTCSRCAKRVALVRSRRTGRWYLCEVAGNKAYAPKPHECDPEGIAVVDRANAAREAQA